MPMKVSILWALLLQHLGVLWIQSRICPVDCPRAREAVKALGECSALSSAYGVTPANFTVEMAEGE
ncbi:hypothetical protein MARPO_0245s0006 [Marchantia polymorpha]|uniref:Uncharacterized protein n=1 Tax=Marchantia polymorpha TaxID=3197 RepID=A0A2R6VZH4_MARPO|nr:hypothetical protein MARPO_0245s0006 [Marchantia polymorpha]|eukprot:PTQ27005.1 hypothetical protein MARPO_0245s0006 [Marchantia polymorpha]